jgi:hypothetical protein
MHVVRKKVKIKEHTLKILVQIQGAKVEPQEYKNTTCKAHGMR